MTMASATYWMHSSGVVGRSMKNYWKLVRYSFDKQMGLGYVENREVSFLSNYLLSICEKPQKELEEIYETYNQKMKKLIPPENLLVWKPSDGWEPLCKFLEVEIPIDPIPVENKTSDGKFFERFFRDRVSDRTMLMIIVRQMSAMLFVTGVLASLSYKAFGLLRNVDFRALLPEQN